MDRFTCTTCCNEFFYHFFSETKNKAKNICSNIPTRLWQNLFYFRGDIFPSLSINYHYAFDDFLSERSLISFTTWNEHSMARWITLESIRSRKRQFLGTNDILKGFFQSCCLVLITAELKIPPPTTLSTIFRCIKLRVGAWRRKSLSLSPPPATSSTTWFWMKLRNDMESRWWRQQGGFMGWWSRNAFYAQVNLLIPLIR